jgi:hypothetical protein
MMPRPILLCVVALPLLAACAGGEAPAGGVPGARGSTVDHVRGGSPAGEAEGVLRPEAGNIWSEGLTPSQPLPNR